MGIALMPWQRCRIEIQQSTPKGFSSKPVMMPAVVIFESIKKDLLKKLDTTQWQKKEIVMTKSE
jgi:hypothetical protein